MSTPIILVCGPAGSGKDTVSGIVARNYNSVCIAQADPMKRFAREVFWFTDNQLWGPSESRNAPDARVFSETTWGDAWRRMVVYAPGWLKELLPNITEEKLEEALVLLGEWFNDVHRYFSQTIRLVDGSRWNRPTARYVLQTIGTEFGRNFSRNVWIDFAMRTARTLLSGGYDYKRGYGLVEKKEEIGPDYVLITDGRFRNELLAVNEANGIVLKVDPISTAMADAAKVDAAGVSGHKSEKELTGMPEHFYSFILGNDKTRGMQVLETSIEMLMGQVHRHTTRIFASQYLDIPRVHLPEGVAS